MGHHNVVEIIGALAQATHPYTGEVFPTDSPYQNEDILNALKIAHEIIDKQKPKITKTIRLAQTSFDGEVIPPMKVLDIVSLVKNKVGEVLVFVQCGFFWEVYNGDALACAELFGWKVARKGENLDFTGVPINAKKFMEILEKKQVSIH